MKNKIMPLIWLVALQFAMGADFDPPIYVFQNGLRLGQPAQEAATLKALGYDGAGSIYAGGLEARIKAYQDAELRIFSIYVAATVNAKGASYDKAIPASIELLKGTDAIVELTIRSTVKDADEQVVGIVREVAELADKAGLRVALYPHAGFYVARIDEAIRIVKKVDRKNVGLQFNLCHFLKSEQADDLEKTITAAGPYLFQVSTSGAQIGGKNWQQLIQPLDRGDFPQKRLFDALRKINFSGAVGLQCYSIKGDAKKNLEASIGAWKSLQADFAKAK